MNLRADEFAGDGRTGTSIESEREKTVAALFIPMQGGWNASAVNEGGLIQLYCCYDSWNVYYVRIHFLMLHTLQRSHYNEKNIRKDWSFTRIKTFLFFTQKVT